MPFVGILAISSVNAIGNVTDKVNLDENVDEIISVYDDESY